MIDQFFFALEAIVKLMRIELILLFQSPLVRGFLIGFIVATMIYGFLRANGKKEKISGLERSKLN